MVRPGNQGYGMTMAIVSAATFGTSGSFGTPLLDGGWTPGAVVLARIGGSAVFLLVPTLWLLHRNGLPSRRSVAHMVAYGLVAVGSATFCYFEAIQYLSVAIALLCEYFAPVLLIAYRWARSRRRPPWIVLLGAVVAMAGMAVVLDVFGDARVDPRGLVWGLGAALSLSIYFLLGERSDADLHPLVVTGVGTVVASAALALGGLVGLIPMHARAVDVTLAGIRLSWVIPVVAVVLVATVLAYLTGIVGVRELGVRLSSFVSLTEVLFAVVAAALLVGQDPTALQGIGAVIVLAGIALVQRAGSEKPVVDEPPLLAAVATTACARLPESSEM